MSDDQLNAGPDFSAVTRIIELLQPLSEEDRRHILQTVSTWFRMNSATSTPLELPAVIGTSASSTRRIVDDDKFSNRPVQSVKDFIFEKAPSNEAERVACLAYYMTHFLDTPHFKNIDLSHLNTEAAQRKFSNPGVAASNAMRDGYIVAASKAGHKQLSAMGERFVQLLPDRAAASAVRQRMASRRTKKSGNVSGAEESEPVEN